MRSMGPVRAGQRSRYGAVAIAAREALARLGAVESLPVAKEFGVDPGSVNSALDDGVRRGRAVRLFRGVYVRPDVADAWSEMLALLNARPPVVR